MALIKSISGFRGTIGAEAGNNLTPKDAVAFATGYAEFIKQQSKAEKPIVALGRDGRLSGEMLQSIVQGTLCACGIDVHLLDYTTTPTIEMYVLNNENVDGGIILTASHNPKEWNALKLLNHKGEFVNAEEGSLILKLADEPSLLYTEIDGIGSVKEVKNTIDSHCESILAHELVDAKSIASKNFKVVIDCINSTAAMSLPVLLKQLGVNNVVLINGEMTGEFAHNPEPLNHNIVDLCDRVKTEKAQLGIAVDPDVDRLSLVDENGNPIGEEYTLVSIADYMLQHKKGAAVSNLSSSRALSDVCKKHGVEYYAAAVGEVNVVTAMKANHALIGGEGNGGIIIPDLHYGRDALIGIALILSYMATANKPLSQIRAEQTHYEMIKDKISLQPNMDVDALLKNLEVAFSNNENVQLNTIDGLKLDFANGWVHCRKSNTEPIIRLYAEAATQAEANILVEKVKAEMAL
jgi:phosphomannomutase